MTQFINDTLSKGGDDGAIDADLIKVNDAQLTVDGSNQLNVTPPPVATGSQDGLMPSGSVTKLAGIEAGAEPNLDGAATAALLDTQLGGSGWRDPARVDGAETVIKRYAAQTVTTSGDVYGDLPAFDRPLSDSDRGKFLLFLIQVDGNTYGHFGMPVSLFLDTTDVVVDGEAIGTKDAWGLSFPISSQAWERIKIAKMSNGQIALGSINNAASINGGFVYLLGVGHGQTEIAGEEVLLNIADWEEPSQFQSRRWYNLPEFSRALTQDDSDRILHIEFDGGGTPTNNLFISVKSFLAVADVAVADNTVLDATNLTGSWSVTGASGPTLSYVQFGFKKISNSRMAITTNAAGLALTVARIVIRLLPMGMGGPDAVFPDGDTIKEISLTSGTGWTEVQADTEIRTGGILTIEFSHSGNSPLEHSEQMFMTSKYFELPAYANTGAIVNAAQNVIRAYGIIHSGGVDHRADIAIARKDKNNFYWYQDGTDTGTTVRIRQHLINGGGSGVDDDEVRALVKPFARANSDEQIGGDLLDNSGVATLPNLTGNIDSLNIGSAYFVESEGAFYEVQADSERATYPLRITFAPDDLGLDNYLVRGWANQTLAEYSPNGPHGSIALAPSVTGTIPARLRGVFAVDAPDGTAGDLVIVLETTSTFVPDAFAWQVGGVRREITGLSQIHNDRSGYRYYLASHEVTAEYANLWAIAKGATADVVIDFDLRDANGNSMVDGAVQTRKLERLSTGYLDRAQIFQQWTQHTAPNGNSAILVDTASGDEYYARDEGSITDLIVEPVNISGFRYGITTANEATANKPAWLRELHYDRTNGEVIFSADDTEMGNAKSLVLYNSDDPSSATDRIVCPLVPLPASSDYTLRGQKHARLRQWGTYQPAIAAAAVSGNQSITNGNMRLYYDATDRKLKAVGTWPDNSRDRWQQIRLQRCKFDVVTTGGHIRLEFNSPHNTLDGGTANLATTTLVGDTAANLHPSFFRLVVRYSDTTNPQDEASQSSRVTNSWVESPFDTTGRTGKLYLAFRFLIQETETDPFVSANVGDNTVLCPLTHSADISSGNSTRRHTYTFDSNAHEFLWSRIGGANREDWWGAALVYREQNEGREWTYCLQPQEYDRVELNGVPIPLKLTRVALKNEHAIERAGGPNDAQPLMEWESDAYDTTQEVPIEAGKSYRVNFLGPRGVRSSRYDADTLHLSTDRAHRFTVLNADGDTMLPASRQYWWDVKSRSSKTQSGTVFPSGRAYQRFRKSGSVYTAYYDLLERRLALKLTASADGDDLNGVEFSRTEFNPVGSLPTSWTLHDLQIVDYRESDPADRTLRIHAATGDQLPTVHVSIENLTRGTSESFNISRLNSGRENDLYSQQGALQNDYRPGDQLTITFSNPGHTTPVVHSHRALIWRTD